MNHHQFHPLAKLACAVVLFSAPTLLLADTFSQTNLVSNIPGLAANTDPNLINPWGISNSPTSPFWVSDQGAGKATLYNGAGTPQALVVTIPPGSAPPSGPTGQVFNSAGGTNFLVGASSATFIFDTLNGTIDGWNGAAGTTAVLEVSTPGAIYTGLTMASSGGSPYIYAADSTGLIRVFDSKWNNVTSTTFAGKFTDPSATAGFVPFNIQVIGSSLFVTYAAITPMGTGLPGGYIDEYDTAGNFIRRVATNGALYAPWGITLAPSNFGSFSNDLLVGNFGNGEIAVYDPTTGAFLGMIDGPGGTPLQNDFLWALETRTGGTGVNTSAVYFTAGIGNQQGGLFGDITEVPEPATILETASGLIAFALMKFRRR